MILMSSLLVDFTVYSDVQRKKCCRQSRQDKLYGTMTKWASHTRTKQHKNSHLNKKHTNSVRHAFFGRSRSFNEHDFKEPLPLQLRIMKQPFPEL